MMHPLNISIVQTDIVWENKQENLRMLRERLDALRGTTEIVVLPEMFSTGFSMRSRELAEPLSGTTVRMLKELADEFAAVLFVAKGVIVKIALSLLLPKWNRTITTSTTFSAWGMKQSISLPETTGLSFLIMGGTFVCWSVTTCVSRYGAGM